MEYVAGSLGIKFQDKDGNMQERAPGELVPEAVEFRNLEMLIEHGFLVEQFDLFSTIKKQCTKTKKRQK